MQNAKSGMKDGIHETCSESRSKWPLRFGAVDSFVPPIGPEVIASDKAPEYAYPMFWFFERVRLRATHTE